MMQLVRREYDPHTGITEEFWFNHLTDEVTIRRLQDVDTEIAINKEMFNNKSGIGYGDSNGQHLVARIPMVLIEKWRQEGFDWDKTTDKERRAWLDKPEHAFLKVRPGKLNGQTRNPLSSKVR